MFVQDLSRGFFACKGFMKSFCCFVIFFGSSLLLLVCLVFNFFYQQISCRM